MIVIFRIQLIVGVAGIAVLRSHGRISRNHACEVIRYLAESKYMFRFQFGNAVQERKRSLVQRSSALEPCPSSTVLSIVVLDHPTECTRRPTNDNVAKAYICVSSWRTASDAHHKAESDRWEA